MNRRQTILLILCCLPAQMLRAYKIITPEPFSIAGKNYFKLQLLAEANDAVPDTVYFDIIYNTGSRLTKKAGPSFSTVITLNQFNDGVFFVKARVYHGRICDTIGSKYDTAGIPVIADRHNGFNETRFTAAWVGSMPSLKKLPTARGYDFTFNNNSVHFLSGWNEDSLFFIFQVRDAHLNSGQPGFIDLFQAKQFLNTLWNADCIEIGFDMLHDRTVWKGKDDYELLADITGRFAGNRWSVADSFYSHWGNHTNVNVVRNGSLNNNQDLDDGYKIYISIPWTELNYTPRGNQQIGFDLQLYDKDAVLDDAFRNSISGTNPESNDNTSEWTSLLLEKKPANFFYALIILFAVLFAFAVYWLFRRNKKQHNRPLPVVPADSASAPPAALSDTIQHALDYIAKEYQDPELSRQQIAAQVFISEKYLSSLFKKEVGVNLVSYINELRIKKAVELLQQTRLPVAEIAFAVGYNSLQNFNKNFRAITQQSPTDYRRS